MRAVKRFTQRGEFLTCSKTVPPPPELCADSGVSPVTRANWRNGLTDRNKFRSAGRTARLGLAACALLLVAVGLTPSTVRAQNSTLVSNLSGSISGEISLEEYAVAQKFTTGTATHGYNIASVTVHVGNLQPDPPSEFDMEIRPDDGGSPGSTAVATLTRSTNLTVNSENILLAPANTTLNPNTSYWIMLGSADDTPVNLAWSATSSAGASTFGWNLDFAPSYRTYGETSWTAFSRNFT